MFFRINEINVNVEGNYFPLPSFALSLSIWQATVTMSFSQPSRVSLFLCTLVSMQSIRHTQWKNKEGKFNRLLLLALCSALDNERSLPVLYASVASDSAFFFSFLRSPTGKREENTCLLLALTHIRGRRRYRSTHTRTVSLLFVHSFIHSSLFTSRRTHTHTHRQSI